jgi:hypothetical protein
MRNFFVFFVLFSFLLSQKTQALSCVSLAKNVSRYQENDAVLSLQGFLYEKGYLKATPNGYFGAGTFSAVKAYQKANGITQTGTAGPLTRNLIKKETCNGVASVKNQNNTATSSKATTTSSILPKKDTTETTSITTPPKKNLSHNELRWQASESLLKALYTHFFDSRGVWPVSASSTVELCVSPIVKEMSKMTMATDTAMTVTTPDSPCKDFVDISYLSPRYVEYVPRDPKLATSSIMTGYTIQRSEFGDITISPKSSDNKEIIKVRCNFIAGCGTVKKINQTEYGIPSITSINPPFLVQNATPKTGAVIVGENFASSTEVVLQSKTTQRIYTLGSFVSNDGKTITLPATTTIDVIPCGQTCKQKLPVGDYSVQIKTPGGESNIKYITIKGFSTATIATRGDVTVSASSSNIKVATVSVSTSIPVTLTSLTLRATSTSKALPTKIVNFKAKDNISAKTLSASGLTFSLGSPTLAENYSRFYDIYVDTKDVLTHEAGFITYGGEFLVKDTLGGVELILPIKEFSFSVSP